MYSLNDLHKTQRGGGVALRATFAALIALGSIPGAAAISPNYSQVAFAATSDSSDDYHFPDKYIDTLTTAADWKTIAYKANHIYEEHYSDYCSCTMYDYLYDVYDKNDDFITTDTSKFKSTYLFALKKKLSGNTDKKEIPITCAYKDIEAALTGPDEFYKLYATVTTNLSTYTKCSDISGFKESITSKPNNDADVSLPDTTAWLLKEAACQADNIGGDYSQSIDNFHPCIIGSQYLGPDQCHFYTSDDNRYYYTDFMKYQNYWAFVLSGLDKNWSFSYENTANGCMLPNRFYEESQRLYNVEDKPKYLVQVSALFVENGGSASDSNSYSKFGMERFSYELPLHTIAKFVKDVTVDTPKTQVPVNNQNSLTEPEIQAIRKLYKPGFIEALKSDITDVNKIKTLVDRATVVQKGTNVLISVPGIKTQVVPVKDIIITLDAAKKEATTTINALSHLTRHVRKPYVLRVKKATTIEDINKAVDEAKAVDAASADAQTARAALGTKIKDATDILKKDAYQYASADPKNAFDTALSNAQLALTDFGKSAADLTSVNSALDDAMDNLDGEDKVFDTKKAAALAKLQTYGLSDEELKPYQAAINNADGTDDINNVLVTLSKKLLAQVIRNANELKTNAVVNYTQASKATKELFENQLSEATTLYEAPDATLLKLDTARDDLSKAMNALDGEAQVQLVSKKNDAKGKLKDYGLSDKDKKQYESDIDNAQSESDVDTLLQKAALTGAKTQAIQAVEDAAKQKKQDLKTNQGTSTDKEIADAQGKVDGFVTTAKEEINKAADEDGVNEKKQAALDNISNVVAANAAKDKLDAAKAQAKKTIGDLKHLEQNDKDDYCGQVDNKSTVDDVNQVVEAAKAADLTKVKDAAKKTIGDLKNLEKKDKDVYCNKVQQASKEDDVNKVVEDAKAADLAKAKEKAKEQLGGLGLSKEDEKKFKDEITNAQDDKAVDAALLKAAKAALEKVITDATAKQKEVAYTKATKEKQQAFDTKLEAAKTAKDATDATVESLNKARTELTDAMGKLDGKADAKTDLQDKKDKAKEQLNGLGLSEQDKKPFENEITNAQDDKAVDAALLKAAKAALEKVITDATAKQKEVAYTKATKEKQQAFDTKLEAAKTAKDATDATVESLNKARTELTDAMGKLDGKEDAKTDLQNKKEKAKEQLGGLGLSKEDEKKFKDEITNAQDDKAVDAALLKAAKAALEKVITDATAKQKEVAYTKATKEKQQAFDTKLEAAKTAKDATDATVESLNKARTELTDAMGKLDGKADQPEHTYVFDAGYIAESEAANATTTLYRLYNPWTHEHLFTTDKAEYDTLVVAGWTGEGSVGMVAVKQGKGVYRLYNPYTGEHHYTTDENEVAACVKAGWVNEGIQFYSVQNGNVPVYSMYNPYEKKFYHHYTSDLDEIARMVNDGWVKEGIKWYESK